MKCVVLTAPGEVVESALHAKHLGYEVEIYPVTRHEAALTDTRYLESALYLGELPEVAEQRPHVRSLRASFINALRDVRYYNEDDIIFCESDFVPIIPAPELKRIINKTFEQHPDIDILRPFQYCEWRDELPTEIKIPENVSFSRMQQRAWRNLCNAGFWGTHALIVPAKNREKIARLFAEYRLPTDITLALANEKGKLKMFVSSQNLFYQINRTLKPQKTSIAGLLSFHFDEIRLNPYINNLIEQDYDNYHLYIIIKGNEDSKNKKKIRDFLTNHYDDARLTFAYSSSDEICPNIIKKELKKNDIVAILNAGIMYEKDYVSNIVQYHNFFPSDICSVYTGRICSIATNNRNYTPNWTQYTLAGSYHIVESILHNSHSELYKNLQDRTVFIDLKKVNLSLGNINQNNRVEFKEYLYRTTVRLLLYAMNKIYAVMWRLKAILRRRS